MQSNQCSLVNSPINISTSLSLLRYYIYIYIIYICMIFPPWFLEKFVQIFPFSSQINLNISECTLHTLHCRLDQDTLACLSCRAAYARNISAKQAIKYVKFTRCAATQQAWPKHLQNLAANVFVPFHCLCMNMLENIAIDPVNWNRANSKESMTSFSLHDSFMKMLTKICQNTCLPAIHGSLGHGLAPALPLPGRNKLLVAQWIDMWIVSSRWVIGCGDMPRQITCRDKLMCVVYLVYNKMYMYDLWHWYDICCTLV